MPPITVGWQASPNKRGTIDLLLSCFTTLSLCAWTAYHPNVPTGRKKRSKLGHRLVWMGIAICIPEVVLWCAWEQWWAAKKLRDRMGVVLEEVRGEREKSEQKRCTICYGIEGEGEREGEREGEGEGEGEGELGEEREEIEVEEGSTRSSIELTAIANEDTISQSEDRHEASENEPFTGSKTSTKELSTKPEKEEEPAKNNPWTLGQAFFALSGGYALPHPDPSLPPITLTATGVLLLARLNILPSASPSAISDKSKADGFAKALVCVQAGWFVIQVVARAIGKLPVTTLEIHVLVHVVFAFAIYAVWFEKGYDVGEAVVADSEEGRDLGALFVMEGFEGDFNDSTSKCACSSAHIDASSITPYPNLPAQHSSIKYWEKILLYFEESEGALLRRTQPQFILDRSSPQHTAQIERANRALRLLKAHDLHITYWEKSMVIDGVAQKFIEMQEGFTVRVRSDLTIQGLDNTLTKSQDRFRETQIKAYGLITFLYGALHLLALSPSHFPTPIEYWLWLASAATMTFVPVSLALLLSMGELSLWMYRTASSRSRAIGMLFRVTEKCLGVIWVLGMTLVAMMAGTCYPFARGYVLVESLMGLRKMDGRVYDMVQWTQWIPHA